MNWLEITIETSLLGRELLLGAFNSIGIEQCQWLEDADEIKRNLEENAGAWDYVNEKKLNQAAEATGIRLFFRDDAIGKQQLNDVFALLADLRKQDFGFPLGSLKVAIQNSEEDDWAQAWKQFYHPFPIGEKLWIKPAWEESKIPKGKIVLEINPGMIFGTGNHATTQLCLEKLEKNVRSGDMVLDIGCGSGILWIASLLLGAKKAVGVDIDPHTIEINQNNAQLNGILEKDYTILVGNILKDDALKAQITKAYDLVVANIVADVIIEMLPIAKEVLKPGGLLIASGIIDLREQEVRQKIEKIGMQIEEIKTKDGWYMLAAKKV